MTLYVGDIYHFLHLQIMILSFYDIDDYAFETKCLLFGSENSNPRITCATTSHRDKIT